jgi:hypothetical protein
MLIAELGRDTERFRWSGEDSDYEARGRLGSLSVHVLAKLEPPVELTDAQLRQRQARLIRWAAAFEQDAARLARDGATREGIRTLNSQLWQWAQRGGKLNWVDDYSAIDRHDGPTDFFGSEITTALRTTYAPPGKDGRTLRLGSPLSALLVSTLEALFTGRLGLCRYCRRLFLRPPDYAPAKRCQKCSASRTNRSVEKAWHAAIARIDRLSPAATTELDALKRRCHDVLRDARSRKLTAAGAKRRLLAIAPPRRRGRPPRKA